MSGEHRSTSSTLAASALSILLFACPAFGQSEPLAPNAEAVQLGYAGLELFEAQRYAEALERFSAAERLAHSPVFVLHSAQCEEKLGRLLAAKARLARLRAPIDDHAPAAWQNAQRDAESELQAIEAQLPRLPLRVRGAAAFPVEVRDGQRTITLNSADNVLELDPGVHTLTLRDARRRALTRTVQITSSGTQPAVDFQFAEDDAPASSLRKWGEWTAVGVGSASLVLGGVAGVVALSKANDVKAGCLENECLARDRGKADSAGRYADLATVAVTVGLVGLGVGITLIATESKPSSPPLRATLKGDMIGLEGAF